MPVQKEPELNLPAPEGLSLWRSLLRVGNIASAMPKTGLMTDDSSSPVSFFVFQ
jgi:hypothetical protein